VIVGFMHGVALVIIGSQLPKVLGIRAEGETTLEQFASLLPRLGDTNPVALAIGAASFAVILLCRRFVPRVPGAVVAGGMLPEHRQRRRGRAGRLIANRPGVTAGSPDDCRTTRQNRAGARRCLRRRRSRIRKNPSCDSVSPSLRGAADVCSQKSARTK
jgi:hypothetical protein